MNHLMVSSNDLSTTLGGVYRIHMLIERWHSIAQVGDQENTDF